MTSRVFVDTNVLVYAEDATAGVKRSRARSLITELASSGALVLSTQILQELYNVVTRKLGISAIIARSLVEDYSKLDVVLVRPEVILGAIDLNRMHALSLWDALVIKCASVAGCSRVLSEDLQHGQSIDGVRIENPFLSVTGAAKPRARYSTGPRAAQNRTASTTGRAHRARR
ncbi:MAG: domain nuclease [Myxococcales bacterium]|nr:domain nuclease [Myxococcales bacterium]